MEPSFHVSSNTGRVLARGCDLLNEHYAGRPFGWRDGGPPLSVLVEQNGVSMSSLYRCLSTTSVWIECGRPDLEHLTVSHLREIAGAPASKRGGLVQAAEQQRWTLEQLRRAVGEVRKADPGNRRGRPRRKPGATFVLGAVRSWVSNPERLEGFEGLRTLGASERVETLRAVETVLGELEMIRYRLQHARS